jgi:chemotaxis protein histidine kinase CheA
MLAKVTLIERAVAAMGTAELDEPRLLEARRSAHMLSGSLGMFGFTRASDAARELELQLAGAARARAPALSALVAIVRRGLDAEAFAARDVDGAQPGDERLRLLVVDEDRDLWARIKAGSTGSPPRT